MARYTVHVLTPKSPDEAFAYMADLRNFAEWDPGVKNVEQIVGEGAGPDSEYDVTVNGFVGDMTLRYVTTAWDAPRSMLVRAESKSITSVDTITVRSADDDDFEDADLDAAETKSMAGGSVVTYDAELTLDGAMGIADPVLQVTFNKIGDKAAVGMVKALGGERIDDGQMSLLAALFDNALEFPVVTSFTRVGYQARQRLADWRDLDTYDLAGRVILLTGATSGLGRAAADQLAACGATLVLVGRNADRNQGVVDAIIAASGNANISQVATDMGDLTQVRALAATVLDRHDRLDAVLHNAGALPSAYSESPEGVESTVASQVAGPFLLTSLLLERLTETGGARVITMASGGMYTCGLSVSGLQMLPEAFKGAEQYARAKRAQVTLNEMWADRHADSGVTFHALHPGWADTPGVAESLPGFAKIMGPLLRTPEEGADTMVWLAADDDVTDSNGKFWLDRRQRAIHKLPTTKATDTDERREKLWNWVTETTGL